MGSKYTHLTKNVCVNYILGYSPMEGSLNRLPAQYISVIRSSTMVKSLQKVAPLKCLLGVKCVAIREKCGH